MNRDTAPTILVADDSAAGRFLLCTLFRRQGWSCRAVEHGGAVLPAVEAERPDLLVVDICMPVLDGVTATRLLRWRLGAGAPPVIATSTLPVERLPLAPATAPEDALFARFVPKPFSPDEIAQCVRAVLANPDAGPRAPVHRAAGAGSPPWAPPVPFEPASDPVTAQPRQRPRPLV